jgi:CheY-like chemotaxis protein
MANNADLVEFRIGPVDAGSARLWLEQAGGTLRALGTAADLAFPPAVLDEFRQLLDDWRAELPERGDGDRPFEWRSVVERSRVQRLATHWTAVARAARTAGNGLASPPPATKPFYDALVHGIGEALQDADDGDVRPTLLSVIPGFSDRLSATVHGPAASASRSSLARIRVLVVDDTQDIRLLVRIGLGLEPDLEVCGEAVDGIDALEQAERLQPDVILLDLGLPRMPGLEALPLLQELLPDARIVVFSADVGAGAVALEAGADAFVPKGSPPERLAEALRATGDV